MPARSRLSLSILAVLAVISGGTLILVGPAGVSDRLDALEG